MERHPQVELLDSRLIHSGRVFDLRQESVRLPSGLEQRWTIVDHPGAVVIAPVFELGDGRCEVLLVRQYRHAIGAWLTELPAGRMERGEDPLDAARRELEEETGLRAQRWQRLAGFYPAPGFCSEHMSVFAATDLVGVAGDRRAQDADEELELLRRPLEQAWAEVALDAKSWIALAQLVQRRREQRPLFE